MFRINIGQLHNFFAVLTRETKENETGMFNNWRNEIKKLSRRKQSIDDEKHGV